MREELHRWSRLWSHRRQLWVLVERDLRQRYLRSRLGFLWALIHPLLLLLLYVYVFSVVLQVKFGSVSDPVGYGLFLFAGFVPWRAIQTTLDRSPTAFIEQARFLERAVVPAYFFPVGVALTSLVYVLIDSAVFLGVLLALGEGPTLALVWFAPAIAALAPLLLGLSLLISVLHVRWRDTAHLCQVLGMLWFLGTPIIYSGEMVPPSLRMLLVLNPLCGLIDLFRHVLLGMNPPDPSSFFSYLAFVGVLLAVARFTYRRIAGSIIDHV